LPRRIKKKKTPLLLVQSKRLTTRITKTSRNNLNLDYFQRNIKKMKCVYFKCGKELKESQMNKHIKEAHPELVITKAI